MDLSPDCCGSTSDYVSQEIRYFPRSKRQENFPGFVKVLSQAKHLLSQNVESLNKKKQLTDLVKWKTFNHVVNVSHAPCAKIPTLLAFRTTNLVFHTNQVRAITIPRDRKIPEGEMLLFGLHPEITEF